MQSYSCSIRQRQKVCLILEYSVFWKKNLNANLINSGSFISETNTARAAQVVTSQNYICCIDLKLLKALWFCYSVHKTILNGGIPAP